MSKTVRRINKGEGRKPKMDVKRGKRKAVKDELHMLIRHR